MKVLIEATQTEFELKREALIKKIAGDKYDVILKSKKKSLYDEGKPAIAERKGYLRVQNEMMDYYTRKFDAMLKEIKNEIEVVLT